MDSAKTTIQIFSHCERRFVLKLSWNLTPHPLFIRAFNCFQTSQERSFRRRNSLFLSCWHFLTLRKRILFVSPRQIKSVNKIGKTTHARKQRNVVVLIPLTRRMPEEMNEEPRWLKKISFFDPINKIVYLVVQTDLETDKSFLCP